jgi:hypothetical protein
LEESGWGGRLVALFILIVPITLAATLTPDRYSPNAVVNKGLYNPNYADTSRADQFSLKNKSTAPTTPMRAEPKVTPMDLRHLHQSPVSLRMRLTPPNRHRKRKAMALSAWKT